MSASLRAATRSQPAPASLRMPAMLAITWRLGIESKFLGKLALFRGPLGPVMRAHQAVHQPQAEHDPDARALSAVTSRAHGLAETLIVLGSEAKCGEVTS